MIELHDMDGCKIAFNPNGIECIQEAEVREGAITRVCLTGGRSVLVNEKYDDVKRMLDDALIAED